MPTGYITGQQALVQVRLRGSDRSECYVDVVVDTGFSEHLTLPRKEIEDMGLSFMEWTVTRLADGKVVRCEVYDGQIYWNGGWRTIPIECSECDPLLGMSLLEDHDVHLEVVEDGTVIIEPRE